MIIEHFFFYRWNELAIPVYAVYCVFPSVIFQTKSSVQSTIAYLKFLYDLNHSSRRFSWLYHYQQKGIDIQFLKIDPRQKIMTSKILYINIGDEFGMCYVDVFLEDF